MIFAPSSTQNPPQDDDDQYVIAYDAACEYSNKQQYQLPYEVVLEGDDGIETEDGTLYSLTPTEEWSRADDDDDDDDDDNNGRMIDPAEWTGDSEEFSVKYYSPV
jgi:hypothetical protein